MTQAAGSDESNVRLLALLNQLTLKALNCDTRKALSFVIVNDTCQLVRYDRAMLWDISGSKPHIVAVSGQVAIEKEAEAVEEVRVKIQGLSLTNKEPFAFEMASPRSGSVDEVISTKASTRQILWIPIFVKDKPTLGLWLERWDVTPWPQEGAKLIQVLCLAYGLAWRSHGGGLKKMVSDKLQWLYAALAALVILMIVPVPLRVAAPCEVVAKDPYLVTAPLDGIIEEIVVKPGQEVEEGRVLFSYDKRIPTQDLQVAEKQVEIAESQLNRASTEGFENLKSLEEAAIWQLQLEKEQISYDFLKERAKELDVKAPIKGVVILDSPDEWRGRKVVTGERVLVISRPMQTKVHIMIPESDNVTIQPSRAIKVFLNTDPLRSYYAKLVYISDYSIVSDKGVVSFKAEADWTKGPAEAKLGVKGTAILYGENVPFLYWLLRKPLTAVREFFQE